MSVIQKLAQIAVLCLATFLAVGCADSKTANEDPPKFVVGETVTLKLSGCDGLITYSFGWKSSGGFYRYNVKYADLHKVIHEETLYEYEIEKKER